MRRGVSTRRAPTAHGLGPLVLGALLAGPAASSGQALSAEDSLLVAEIYAEMVEIPSVSASEDAQRILAVTAARLETAGIETEIAGPDSAQVLVARLAGTGERPPLLLLAHLDVVPALREDWSVDPFTLVLDDGWWYGRGTEDNKAGAAFLVFNLIRAKRDGFVPDRDWVVALTSDEETESAGIRWLVTEGRERIGQPEFALNTDSGGGITLDGRDVMFNVQASEKVYLTFELEVDDDGGHSSRPTPDNAIDALALGLVRLAEYRFPVTLNEVTRGFFERSAAFEEGPVAADMRAVAAIAPDSAAAARLSQSPFYNALLRTTCTATRLEAGHADNALPQTARATVNCRILPGEPIDAVDSTLNAVLADPRIRVTRKREPTASPPSPLRPEILEPIEAIVEEMWPNATVVPVMSTGATDGLYVRNAGIPVYGAGAIFDDSEEARAHGRDERVSVKRFYEALEFWNRLMRRVSR
ncbi:MAG TPA: M20/M25/M40 family metallo-hydrolase [Gemmatimonadota bacterium]|nr:M20/M25/M40 family metallo-hydrolase [Gemmatimonadota bacterium]